MWGSKLLGNYAKQAMNAGQFNRAMAASGIRHGIEGIRGASAATFNKLGVTGTSMALGGIAGGAYGAFSDDGSMIGGALGGATLGAMGGLGFRYGSIAATNFGLRRAMGGTVGESFSAAATGLWGKASPDTLGIPGIMRQDIRSMVEGAERIGLKANQAFGSINTTSVPEPILHHAGGALMAANQGINKISSTLKGWNI